MVGMKVVITGGCGFIGQVLAREILQRGEPAAACFNHKLSSGFNSCAILDSIKNRARMPLLDAIAGIDGSGLGSTDRPMHAADAGVGQLTSCVGGPSTKVSSVVLADIAAPPKGQWVCPDVEADPRVSVIECDIGDSATASVLVDQDDISVFHLSAIMSGAQLTSLLILCSCAHFANDRSRRSRRRGSRPVLSRKF
eukprot:COSAG02_NODE_67_length_42609_cov_14.506681_14_plen_196_part_00